ncbi:electron transfer flavoprotein subunit alpha/FixB family protein [Lacihabitans sp. CS3-21]|uniref:electron transfer flavoprotein subunit alpha/FixB family protein n=1 Tax=Lacihabitans sp. CS3-21 TaxID=2487332 RepID=UPI0020CEC3A9|nr:electron transfer flavoprotein subunit alpha/FixB family protein [Lacihabitans sp. CS3-21]MCP9746382.1 electron transfer flavoprotein subunit alpha/FixB family protein [Lacihabitans sp. CS3-21]
MSVLVYTELADGQFKKSSLEAIFYGSKVAAQVGASMTVLAIGSASDDELAKAGNFGATKVLHANAQNLTSENIMAYSKVLSETAKSLSAKIVISAKSSLADAVMARAAGALKAGLVGNVVELPETSNGFKVKRSIFTGKAFAETSINSEVKFIAIKKNVLPLEESANAATVEKLSVDTGSLTESSKVLETIKASGTVSLPEADLVVSGGRGMKGPENWQPLLDLAEALGAATACSKPVSDLDWRPHHEHVGQTGVKVAPNLYIACGISGAIQHLAGVNSSKVIVVINKDPEAPFFKAADYGIVGDVFDVLPKLTAAVKAL